jgi:hypothetical protein
MRMSNPTRSVIMAVSAAIALGAAQSAVAKTKEAKKPTYEEAWTLCTAQLNRNHILVNEAGQRYAAGAACMMHYGYRI